MNISSFDFSLLTSPRNNHSHTMLLIMINLTMGSILCKKKKIGRLNKLRKPK